jgi:hypothetical protein
MLWSEVSVVLEFARRNRQIDDDLWRRIGDQPAVVLVPV